MPNLDEKIQRLAQIEAELEAMPKARAGEAAGGRKWKLYNERRRIRLQLARAIGSHTLAEWRALLLACGRRCAKCGATGRLSKDHIVPVCDGGSDAIGNIQPLCVSCNSKKGGRRA